MHSELVSVIIPTFNRAYCLSRSIDSVLQQSHKCVEVIIIDDGSTDGTEQMLRDRYSNNPRIRCYSQEHKGVSAARNLAIAKVKGDYVAFLDSDDIWFPWKVELQLECLRCFLRARMVSTDMEAVDETGHVVASRYLRRMYTAYQWFTLEDLFTESYPLSDISRGLPIDPGSYRVYCGDIFSQMIMGNLVHTPTVLLGRDRLEQVMGFNEDLLYSGEDYDFHIRTCREGPVAFIDYPTIQYRVGAKDQLTQPIYSIHLAKNKLKTILPILSKERDRINLPTSMIHRALAEGYGWLGEMQLDNGEPRLAAENLFRSLRYRAWQPRIASLAVLSLLPRARGESVRDLIKIIKERISHSEPDPGQIHPGAKSSRPDEIDSSHK